MTHCRTMSKVMFIKKDKQIILNNNTVRKQPQVFPKATNQNLLRREEDELFILEIQNT